MRGVTAASEKRRKKRNAMPKSDKRFGSLLMNALRIGARSASRSHGSGHSVSEEGALDVQASARAIGPWLVVGIVLAIMPYACIDLDVNVAEEAELWRLERGCASPRTPPMVDGMVPSWAIGVPLAQMNMEAGAANEQADAVGQQAKRALL